MSRPALGVSMGAWIALWTVVLLTGFVIGSRPAVAQSVTPAGTSIQNVATVSFIGAGGAPATISSNQVSATVTPPPSVSAVQILRAAQGASGAPSMAGPTQCSSSAGLITLPPPMLSDGATLDPSQPIVLAGTSTLHGGEAAFVQVTDADQNVDASAIDQTTLRLTTPTGDAETLRLSETGVNTGVFVGYIQTRAAAVTVGNCVLEVERNGEIVSIYVDAADASDTASASALVDPYGLIFDSRTGTPINGALVRLMNTATGAPAVVVGDDGVSVYPSQMLTGTQVTDAGGTVYVLPAGVFRFPLVPPGSYRLEVDPPAGYAFPSQLTVAELGLTPGAPF
ncbi:MAG: hypothetical protein ACREUC_10785, partial [Steroidobacteraceae bacterium]